MTLGQTIKRMREKKKISRDELAEQLDIHVNSIIGWENDKHCPSLFFTICIADAFGCTLDELVGRTTTPK